MVPSGELKIGETMVEVYGFEGQEGYLFVLIDPTKRPRGRVTDGYYPYPDFGHIWLREDGEMWVASGSVSVELVGDSGEEIDRLLDFVADELLTLGYQLSSTIQVFEVRSTRISSNEEGPLIFKGPNDGMFFRSNDGTFLM